MFKNCGYKSNKLVYKSQVLNKLKVVKITCGKTSDFSTAKITGFEQLKLRILKKLLVYFCTVYTGINNSNKVLLKNIVISKGA